MLGFAGAAMGQTATLAPEAQPDGTETPASGDEAADEPEAAGDSFDQFDDFEEFEQSGQESVYDPLSGYNRAMTTFNDNDFRLGNGADKTRSSSN
ncbi:MAG: hypothetical protein ACQERN_13855, partial [Thermodesulfobacteriota bacterium]